MSKLDKLKVTVSSSLILSPAVWDCNQIKDERSAGGLVSVAKWKLETVSFYYYLVFFELTVNEREEREVSSSSDRAQRVNRIARVKAKDLDERQTEPKSSELHLQRSFI